MRRVCLYTIGHLGVKIFFPSKPNDCFFLNFPEGAEKPVGTGLAAGNGHILLIVCVRGVNEEEATNLYFSLSLFCWWESKWLALPVNWADAGNILLVADAFGQEPVSYLPGEHCWVLALVVGDGVDDVGRGHFRLAPANHARLEAARLVVPNAEKNQDERDQ